MKAIPPRYIDLEIKFGLGGATKGKRVIMREAEVPAFQIDRMSTSRNMDIVMLAALDPFQELGSIEGYCWITKPLAIRD